MVEIYFGGLIFWLLEFENLPLGWIESFIVIDFK